MNGSVSWFPHDDRTQYARETETVRALATRCAQATPSVDRVAFRVGADHIRVGTVQVCGPDALDLHEVADAPVPPRRLNRRERVWYEGTNAVEFWDLEGRWYP